MDGAAGEGDTSVMVEGNVSEIAERATEGRRGGSGVILPILLRPPSLPPSSRVARTQARTLHMPSGSKARKEEIRAAALLPQHCGRRSLSSAERTVKAPPRRRTAEGEEDKWTCPHRCAKPQLDAPPTDAAAAVFAVRLVERASERLPRRSHRIGLGTRCTPRPSWALQRRLHRCPSRPDTAAPFALAAVTPSSSSSLS